MNNDRLFDGGGMSRRRFLIAMGAASVTLAGYAHVAKAESGVQLTTVKEIKQGEDVFAYIRREKGSFDQTFLGRRGTEATWRACYFAVKCGRSNAVR